VTYGTKSKDTVEDDRQYTTTIASTKVPLVESNNASTSLRHGLSDEASSAIVPIMRACIKSTTTNTNDGYNDTGCDDSGHPYDDEESCVNVNVNPPMDDVNPPVDDNNGNPLDDVDGNPLDADGLNDDGYNNDEYVDDNGHNNDECVDNNGNPMDDVDGNPLGDDAASVNNDDTTTNDDDQTDVDNDKQFENDTNNNAYNHNDAGHDYNDGHNNNYNNGYDNAGYNNK